jgi:hypothetical protein
MIVPPGLRMPRLSASSIMVMPILSLTEPPGFRYSSFARRVALVSGAMCESLSIGVLPITSRIELYHMILPRFDWELIS